MTKLIVSVADGYENGRSDALKSRCFQIVPSRPVLSPMTSVLGSLASGTDEAASKNFPGTASLMSVNVTVCACALAAGSSRAAITVTAFVFVLVMCALSHLQFLAFTGLANGLSSRRLRLNDHARYGNAWWRHTRARRASRAILRLIRQLERSRVHRLERLPRSVGDLCALDRGRCRDAADHGHRRLVAVHAVGIVVRWFWRHDRRRVLWILRRPGRGCPGRGRRAGVRRRRRSADVRCGRCRAWRRRGWHHAGRHDDNAVEPRSVRDGDGPRGGNVAARRAKHHIERLFLADVLQLDRDGIAGNLLAVDDLDLADRRPFGEDLADGRVPGYDRDPAIADRKLDVGEYGRADGKPDENHEGNRFRRSHGRPPPQRRATADPRWPVARGVLSPTLSNSGHDRQGFSDLTSISRTGCVA